MQKNKITSHELHTFNTFYNESYTFSLFLLTHILEIFKFKLPQLWSK